MKLKRILTIMLCLAMLLVCSACDDEKQEGSATTAPATTADGQTDTSDTTALQSESGAADKTTSGAQTTARVDSTTAKQPAGTPSTTTRRTPVNTTRPVVTTTTKKTPATTQRTTANDGTVTINGKKWRETFFDDFNGTTLDTTKWSLCPEWTRHEKNVWRNDMTSLDGKGNLVLSVGKEGNVYKSGGIRSRDKFDQKYGYFEIRCELQKTPGFWGAFWLMPYSIDNGTDGGADGTEIDIFESAYWNTDKINHALHWDDYGERHKSTGTQVYVKNIYQGFHTFALEWNSTSYNFYIDGVRTYRVSASKVDICRVPTYLKVTVEVGSWGGKVIDSLLPDGITVDYVRVYERA